MTKTCSKCKKEKNLNEFYPDKRRNTGKQSQCKECQLKQKSEYYKNNPDVREKKKTYSKQRLLNNPKARKMANESANRHYHNNKQYYTKYRRKWRNNPINKENERKQHRLAYNTINGKINGRISTGVYQSLKENKKRKTWKKLVGYDSQTLKIHLESRFTEGMNWQKFLNGEIEIDHILPKELFEFENNEDPLIKICWALNNLRPLWTDDNNSKSDILPDGRHARDLTKQEKLDYLKELGII